MTKLNASVLALLASLFTSSCMNPMTARTWKYCDALRHQQSSSPPNALEWNIVRERDFDASIDDTWKATGTTVQGLQPDLQAIDEQAHFMSLRVDDKSFTEYYRSTVPIVYVNVSLSPQEERKTKVRVSVFCRAMWKDPDAGLRVSSGEAELEIFDRIGAMLVGIPPVQ